MRNAYGVVTDYASDEVERFEVVRADSLRFGDFLPFWHEHVRTVQMTEGDPMVRLNTIRRLGSARARLAFYPGDMVSVVRAGSARA